MKEKEREKDISLDDPESKTHDKDKKTGNCSLERRGHDSNGDGAPMLSKEDESRSHKDS